MGVGGMLLRSIARPLAAARRLTASSPPLPPPRAASPCHRLRYLRRRRAFSLEAPRPYSSEGRGSSRPPISTLPPSATSSTPASPRGGPDWRLARSAPRSDQEIDEISECNYLGPFAWIQSVPGEPVPTSQPNEGSVTSRGRKEKKRIRQRREFIAGEEKKRKAAFAEHKRKRRIERIERKMAAVAREKTWTLRLIELQQLEEARKAAHAL